MRLTRPMRLARASVFATMCLAVSAAGHLWMSGRPIPVTALIPGFGLVFALALAAAGRPRGYAPIATLMLASEAALHLLFAAGQHVNSGADAMQGMPGMPNMPGMDMTPMPAMPSTPTGTVPMTMIAGHGALGMIAVHAVAGLICAAWLHQGERAFFALLARTLADVAAAFRLLVDSCAAPVAVPPRTVANPAAGPPLPAYPTPLVHALIRRGPPGLIVAD